MDKKRRTLNKLTVSGMAASTVLNSWTKPIINSVVSPAHSQMSCSDISTVDVVGRWRFTSSDNIQFDIEFLDENSWSSGSIIRPLVRVGAQLALDIGIGPALIVIITEESNCVASELEIQNNNQFFTAFTPPATGVRIQRGDARV